MIDLADEHLIPIRDVPRLLPARPNGKRIHISAVYRWIQRGTGGVKLEHLKLGGTTYTSLEALQRFADRRTLTTQTAVAGNSIGRLRQSQIEEANRVAEAILQGRNTSSRGERNRDD